MQCLTPLTIKNPKPNVLGQGTHMEVPCGKCKNCILRRAAHWAFRLECEELRSRTSAFITYTYDNDNVPRSANGFLNLSTTDFQSYMKRQRKAIADNYGKDYWRKHSIKYYMAGEYGSQTERPHYHAIMFNLPEYYLRNDHRITEIWKKGRVQVDEVSPASIRYVTGYLHKQLYWANKGQNDDRQREFSRMSKGIGENYLTDARIKSMKSKLNPYLSLEDGIKMSMPRYYKNKVFNEEELEILRAKGKKFLEGKEELPTLDKIAVLQQHNRNQKRLINSKRNKL